MKSQANLNSLLKRKLGPKNSILGSAQNQISKYPGI